MAIRIILPDYLERKAESLLLAALQDFGAQHIRANEWRFSQMPLNCQEFLGELKLFFPKTERWLVDRLKVTILGSSEHGSPTRLT
jgi:hypothetical protein